MPKYWGKQIFSLGKKKIKFGNNNGQLRIANATSDGARKVAWANHKIKVHYFYPCRK